jgi:hypothetical protein
MGCEFTGNFWPQLSRRTSGRLRVDYDDGKHWNREAAVSSQQSAFSIQHSAFSIQHSAISSEVSGRWSVVSGQLSVVSA